MSSYKVTAGEASGALIQNKVKGEGSLKCAGYFAIFSILNDMFILPALLIVIFYLSIVMQGDPDPLNGGTAPGDNYLCQCCDSWDSGYDLGPYYCCGCTNTDDDGLYGGNSLVFSGWALGLSITFGMLGGMSDMLATATAFFIFLFTCLWGTDCKDSFIKGMSLNGLRYTQGGMRWALAARLIMFITALIFYLTKPDIHCGCNGNSDDQYAMKFGPQYDEFKWCDILLVAYLIFNLLFLLSRRILLGLLGNVSIETDMIVFRLCYIQVEQI